MRTRRHRLRLRGPAHPLDVGESRAQRRGLRAVRRLIPLPAAHRRRQGRNAPPWDEPGAAVAASPRSSPRGRTPGSTTGSPSSTAPHRRGRAAARHRLVDGHAGAHRRRHRSGSRPTTRRCARGRRPRPGRVALGRPGARRRSPATRAPAGCCWPTPGRGCATSSPRSAASLGGTTCSRPTPASSSPARTTWTRCSPSACPTAGCTRCPGRTPPCWPTSATRIPAARARRDPGPVRPAGGVRDPRDGAARRPPRRPGVPRRRGCTRSSTGATRASPTRSSPSR